MKALVLGGYGSTGSPITALLRAGGDIAWTAGRDASRADRVVDLRRADAGTVRAAVSDVDVVVNATGLEEPAVVEAVLSHGVAFVDISATTSYVDALAKLDPPAALLLSVGLAPGLTSMLAAEVHRTVAGPIDVALMLGTGEHYGPASVAWSANLLGRRFTDPATGSIIRNYTRPARFDLPGHGHRTLLRTDFSDQHTLTRDLGVPVRTYFGLSSRLATASLAVMTRLPGFASIVQRLHLPGRDTWLAMARGADGTTRWATGRPQAYATAALAVLAARVAPQLGPGVHHLHNVVDLADVPTGDQLWIY